MTSEALFLAYQINGLFSEANRGKATPLWNVTIQPRQFSRALFWDIRIFGQNADAVRSLREALSEVKIPFSTEAVPNLLNNSPGMMINGGPPSAAIIFVGSKRPPN